MRIQYMAALLCIWTISVQAAPSYLGPSGSIMAPDELTTRRGQFSVGYHRLVDIGFRGVTTDLNVWHGNYGLTSNVEVGSSSIDARDDGANVSVNAKWRILDETISRPALAVGVIDAAGNAIDDDPSYYLLVAKDLAGVSGELRGNQERPARGVLGIGTGMFDGVFLGLDWVLVPGLSFVGDFLRGGDFLGRNTISSGGFRYAVNSNLTVDAAAIDFSQLAFGLSYNIEF